MGWVGLARNIAKIGLGVVEGDIAKVVKCSGKAVGHAVSGTIGIFINEDIQESIDEFLEEIENADDNQILSFNYAVTSSMLKYKFIRQNRRNMK